MLRAVLDANVYVSAYVRPEGPPGQIVERFLRDAAFDVILSTAVVGRAMLQATADWIRGRIIENAAIRNMADQRG